MEYLLGKGLINPIPSNILQKIYDAGELSKARLDELKKTLKETPSLDTRKQLVAEVLGEGGGVAGVRAHQTDPEKEQILVSKGTGKLISLCFDLPQVEVEIERAVAQVKRAMTETE